MGLKSVFANNEMWWANNVISHLRQSGDWMRQFPGFPFNGATLFFVLYICIMIDLNRSRHFHFCPTAHRRKEKRIKVFNSSLTDTSYEVIYINFIWLAAINRSYKKERTKELVSKISSMRRVVLDLRHVWIGICIHSTISWNQFWSYINVVQQCDEKISSRDHLVSFCRTVVWSWMMCIGWKISRSWYFVESSYDRTMW